MEIPKLNLNFLNPKPDTLLKKQNKRSNSDYKINTPESQLKAYPTSYQEYSQYKKTNLYKSESTDIDSINEIIKPSFESMSDLKSPHNYNHSTNTPRNKTKPPLKSNQTRTGSVNKMLESFENHTIDTGELDKISDTLIQVLKNLAKEKQSSELKLEEGLVWSRSASARTHRENSQYLDPQQTILMYNSARITSEEKIFESFLKRNFDTKSQHDITVMGIIVYYEQQMKIIKERYKSETRIEDLMLENQILKDRLEMVNKENGKDEKENM